jgi:FkbM family methyltransferase
MNIDITKALEGVRRGRILHIGANTGQEYDLYRQLGFNNNVWVEMDKKLCDELETKCKGDEVFNCAVGKRIVMLDTFYSASNNNESASLLPPKKHIEKYESVVFLESKALIQQVTIDRLIDNNINIYNIPNVLILDIQGNELNALKGMYRYRKHFDVIITEAYTEELYEGCGMLDDIKQLLSEHYDFIEYAPEVNKGWGDALFKLKK